MLIIDNHVLNSRGLYLWTPESSQHRNLLFVVYTSLQKSFILYYCSSDDVLVVAPDTAVQIQFVIMSILVLVLLEKLDIWIPLALFEDGWHLLNFLWSDYFLFISS